jgi:hypothetical protein
MGKCYVVTVVCLPEANTPLTMPRITDLLTDEYGQSYDLIEVEACTGFAIGMILYTIGCFHHIDFNFLNYAGGFATMVTATAASRRIKPPAVQNTPT